jgi:fucose 4-O-acetylase-like acetyltransferase
LQARREDIDAAKGMAILFVVFGHLVARADPAGVAWYEPLRQAVYAFHMPLFLYLSGLVAVESGMLFTPRPGWRGVVAARAKRLLLPFFGLGLLIVCGKLALAPVMSVDNAPAAFWSGVSDLLWHTATSPALSIWYLFVLFVVGTASMAALNGRPARLPLLLAVSLVVYALPLPAYAYTDRVGRYAVFFLLGTWAGMLGERWLAFIDRAWRPAMAALFAALAAIIVFGRHWPEAPVLLGVGVLSFPALHGFLRNLPDISLKQSFLFLGRYSFMIYLFNTLFIGLAKGALLRRISWDGANFYGFAAVLMLSGVFGPVALKRYIFAYVPYLDRLTN